jgi:hypothetical protein
MSDTEKPKSFTHELICNYLKSCGFTQVSYKPEMFDYRAIECLDNSFNIRVFEKQGWGRVIVANNIYDNRVLDKDHAKVTKMVWFSRTQDGAAILYNATTWNSLVDRLARVRL